MSFGVRYLMAVAICCAPALTDTATACDFGGNGWFEPTLKRWDQHPGPAQTKPGSDGDYWERIPKPVVQIMEITRGKVAPGVTCDDAGTVRLEISLSGESTYSIGEFGIYFRILSGEKPYWIFPDTPLTGIAEGDKKRFLFPWLDGHPSTHRPIDMEVEVFFVTNGLNIGPVTKVRVVHNP